MPLLLANIWEIKWQSICDFPQPSNWMFLFSTDRFISSSIRGLCSVLSIGSSTAAVSCEVYMVQ